jgi:hypothetical protein
MPRSSLKAWIRSVVTVSALILFYFLKGEKRTPYITRDPEKYYTSTGEWRGWAHFLGYGGEVFSVTNEPTLPASDKPGIFTKCI